MFNNLLNETKTKFQRISGAFVGVFFGILIFFGSFALIFWNEVKTPNYEIYKDTLEIKSNELGSNKDKLVAIRGTIKTDEKLSDFYGVNEVDALVLNRKVEIYAWEEDSKTNSEDKKEYTYKKVWTSKPEESKDFNQSGHDNIEKTIQDETFYAQNSDIEGININISKIDLPGFSTLKLEYSPANITPTPSNTTNEYSQYEEEIFGTQVYLEGEEYDLADDEVKITSGDINTTQNSYVIASNQYSFVGKGTLEKPEIGDMRISYTYLPNNYKSIIFGKAGDNEIVTYKSKENIEIFRAFEDMSFGEALDVVKGEDNAFSWMMRILGFFMMWMGLLLILGPITAIADLIPFVGKITGCAIAVITFVISLILTLITMLLGIIFNNIFLIAGITFVVAVAITAGVLFYYNKKNNSNTTEKTLENSENKTEIK